ncbi:MAG: hypothetical protein NVSMB13_04720 [Mycobacteriales bacterium]
MSTSRRLAERLASVVLGLAVLLASGAALSAALGWRPLVVRSDSMAPTVRAGDLIFVRRTTAADVRVGQVTAFADYGRAGRLVTHRVVAVSEEGSRRIFTTRGDANSGTEQWSVPGRADVGVQALRLPGFGRALAPLNTVPVRLGLGALVAMLVLPRLSPARWRPRAA